MSSSGTTRKNVGFLPSVVSAGNVAEPETNAIPALPKIGPTASTSWLPAGPIDATALEATTDWVFCTASEGVSWVSSWASVTLVWLAALSSATASCAKCSCSRPTCATGPVSGPSIAIGAVHDFELPLLEAAAVLEVALLVVVLLLLLLPQPAATSAVT